MKTIKKIIVLMLTLVLVAGIIPESGMQAASKPGKPTISLSAEKNGTAIKITISKNLNAQGYIIYMKSAIDLKYRKIKTLKKDGSAERSYTIKNLSEGTYSFKVKAYVKDGGKTVKSAYSSAKKITLSKEKKDGNSKITSELAKLKKGDTFKFGTFEQDNNTKNGKEAIEWIVLSKTDSEIFAVSKYALDNRAYDEKGEKITWADCTLRKWLNGEFYNSAFSDTEKSLIKTTSLKNNDNPQYGTEGGQDTKDKIFLLSVEDVTNPAYGFSSSYEEDKNRRCIPTIYAESKRVLPDGTTPEYNGRAGDWWLRTPGSFKMTAANVIGAGRVFIDGYSVDFDMGSVRPAMYIKL